MESVMNWDRIEGKWKQLNGKMLETWGKLTHEDIDIVLGKSIYRSGKLQEARGIREEEERRQFEEFDSAIHNVVNPKKK